MPIEPQAKAAKAALPGKLDEQALFQRQWLPADFRSYGDKQSKHIKKLNSDAVKQMVASGHDLIRMNLYSIGLTQDGFAAI